MQANTSPACRPRIAWTRWLPALLAVWLAAAAAAAAAPASSTALPTYRVVQLSTGPDTYYGAVNAKGQVAFTEYDNGAYRAKFYDGHRVRNLGTLGGPFAYTAAVNDLGQVAGTSDVTRDGSISHAFRWSAATGMVDLTPAVKQSSIGTDINKRGHVAGTLLGNSISVPTQAFLWRPQTGARGIGVLDTFSWAAGMNDADAIAGYGGTDSLFGDLGFLWTPTGGIRNVDTLPNEFTLAADVNNLGHVVGATPFPNEPFPAYAHAFLWTPQAGPIDLGTGSAPESSATAVNDHDMVVGRVRDFHVFDHGFVWTRDMGLLEFAPGHPEIGTFVGGLNNLGQVVGGYDDWAFLWTRAHGLVDLNTRLVGAPPGLRLTGGYGISDGGQIVAHANTGVVLLVPASAAAHAPAIGPIASTGTPRANTALSFAAAVADADPAAVHKAAWDWGDGSTATAAVSEKQGAGSASGQHVFRAPGIYTVKLTVADSGGRSTTVGTKVVVAAAGACTAGAGSFMSPSGAATFAFLAHGGQGSVEFSTAGLSLRNAHIDTQAVRDGKLEYRGSGAVNGTAGYRFLLTATPGGQPDGNKATVRMRIWHAAPGTHAEVVDYDNLSDPHAAGGAGAVVREGTVTIQPD